MLFTNDALEIVIGPATAGDPGPAYPTDRVLLSPTISFGPDLVVLNTEIIADLGVMFAVILELLSTAIA